MNINKSSKILPSIYISGKSFANSWSKLVMETIQKGVVLPTKKNNMTKNVQSTVVMTGEAIRQIDDFELHSQDPYGRGEALVYVSNLMDGYDYLRNDHLRKDFRNNPDLLTNCLTHRYWSLKGVMFDLSTCRDYERGQPAMWQSEDKSSCLQQVLLKPLTFQNNKMQLEIQLTWRSCNAYSTWSTNLCVMLWMLKYRVLSGVIIVKIVNFCDNTYIYDYDWDAARKVRPII